MFKLKKERISQKKINSGGFGYVYPYQKDPDDLKWVVKRIPVNDADELLNCLPEIVLGFSCDHPCIVPLKGYHIEKRSEGDYWVYLKFPRMKENLKDRFEEQKKKKTPFSEQEIVQYFYSLVSAADYLHTKKIYHRDIKPANILLDYNGDAKLCDIGVAKYVGEEETYQQLTGKGGTIDYTAPEILQGKGKLTKESLRANDVWSIGLVMLELCALDKRILNPYSGPDKIQEDKEKLQKKLKETYIKKLVDLIFGLLKVDPNERMKIEDVKKILEEEYSYCRNIERDSKRYECKSLKENNKRLKSKYIKTAEEMIVLIRRLKEENEMIKNELKEFEDFAKKYQLQILSDIDQHYSKNIEKLKGKCSALNQEGLQKEKQERGFRGESQFVQFRMLNQATQTLDEKTKKKIHNPYPPCATVAIFGPKRSGKRALIGRLAHETFHDGQKFRTFEDFSMKTLVQDNKALKTRFWKSGCNNRETKLGPIGKCDALLLIYDITSKESFFHLTLLYRFHIGGENPILFVIGTKLDLESQRQVTKAGLRHLQKKMKLYTLRFP